MLTCSYTVVCVLSAGRWVGERRMGAAARRQQREHYVQQTVKSGSVLALTHRRVACVCRAMGMSAAAQRAQRRWWRRRQQQQARLHWRRSCRCGSALPARWGFPNLSKKPRMFYVSSTAALALAVPLWLYTACPVVAMQA